MYHSQHTYTSLIPSVYIPNYLNVTITQVEKSGVFIVQPDANL
jgi:hypothetical protein